LNPVKILAIRFARLGDVILLLPALQSLKDKFPSAELTLLTGHRCAPVAELCPAVDHVIAVDRLAMRDGPVRRAIAEMTSLAVNLRRKQFDLAIDFHSFRETNVLTFLSGARSRIGMKRHAAAYWKFCFNLPPVVEDKSLHVMDMFQKVVASVGSQAENHPSRMGKQQASLGRLVTKKASIPTIALYIDAPVPERIWPPERFAAIANFAVEELGAAVQVISSSESRALAARVQTGSRHPEKLALFTDLTLSELAGVIASAHLLISNDTGPMHLGPALGVPTLALFSVGYPEHFRPTGPRDRFLRANPIDEIAVHEVKEVIEEMWATVDRDLQR
jgi:ADP-heptose:LPS heptosyltransferase